MSGTLSVGNKEIFTHSDATDKVTMGEVLGLPTQVFAYGFGSNFYDGDKIKYGNKRIASGITFGPSDDANATNFVPPSTGYYHIDVNINFFNEPPAGSENDAGVFTLNWQGSAIEYLRCQFYVNANATSHHEGKGLSASCIHQVTSVGGSNDYFDLRYTGFTPSAYNENYRVTIFKLSS